MKAMIRILFLFNPYIIINRVLNSVLIYLFTCLAILLFSAANLVKNNELRGGESPLIKLNRDKIVIVSSIYKYVWLKKWYVEFAIEMFLIMLFCAGYAIYNSWLFIVSEQILAFEQHLSHAVHCHVEDGADVGSGIYAAVRSDVLGKLLDGHHIGVLRDGECILLLGLHWWPAPAII